MSARDDYPHLAWLEPQNNGREVELALDEIDRLRKAVDRAIRYVRAPHDLAEMAHRGSQVFGKAWMDVIDFKPSVWAPPSGPRVAGVPPWQGGRLLERAT